MVTPLVGVWIEISGGPLRCSLRNVTPLVGVWIEISYELPYRGQAHSHSPCGSVDWNIVTNAEHNRRTCHSPCGSVDWNDVFEDIPTISVVSLPLWECGLKLICLFLVRLRNCVTPLVGVWIEILSKYLQQHPLWSLPLWECGLKLHINSFLLTIVCHSPCGSVDWNHQ